MSWIDQGRQEHGWFGHGTSPHGEAEVPDDPLFGPDGLSARMAYAAYGTIAALPRALRPAFERNLHAGGLKQMQESLRAWAGADGLSAGQFHALFAGSHMDVETATRLHEMATQVAFADRRKDLLGATESLAAAVQSEGIGQWPRALAGAHAATATAMLSGVVRLAPLVVVPAARFVLQALPKLAPFVPGIAGGIGVGILLAPTRLGDGTLKGIPASRGNGDVLHNESSGKPDESEKPEPAKPIPPLPANPEDLLKEGWVEISHPDAAASGSRTFRNPNTGMEIVFDKGRIGQPGFRGRDHYHVTNPHGEKKVGKYLDRNGIPVNDGASRSHIIPER